jgi:hypothetical protein
MSHAALPMKSNLVGIDPERLVTPLTSDHATNNETTEDYTSMGLVASCMITVRGLP